MQTLLLNNRLMPIYGLLIRICHYIGLYTPIIWLTIYFMEEKTQRSKTNKITILALGGERFRGDLETLEASGKFKVITLPYGWQNRLLYCFFRINPTFEAVFHPNSNEQKHHDCLNLFMQKFLPLLYKKAGIDIVISAAAHYQNDYLWGANSSLAGVPFVIFHRECFHTTKERRDFWIKRWKPAIGKYIFDFCVFHNEVIRKNYADSGVFPLEKTASAGAMRMDAFVSKYLNKKPSIPEKKQVTFFSFHHCVGLGGAVPLWSPYDVPVGFTTMFEETHVAFAKFAKANPDISCILKPKWGGIWIEEFHKVFERNNIDIFQIPNLKIIENTDVHKLIENSTVICSYGSTTLLEASVMGRPVVITVMGEGLRDDYQNQIQMRDDFKYYDIAYNENDLFKLLKEKLENPLIDNNIQKEREALFDKWISPLDASAVKKYIAILEQQYKLKNKKDI